MINLKQALANGDVLVGPFAVSGSPGVVETIGYAGYDFAIIGVGGLASPADFAAYIKAGADAVQGATGPMWNHRLAVEIATSLKPVGAVSTR